MVRLMYFQIISQMKKTLAQFDVMFDAAEAHAKAKSFDTAVYMGLRLAPDQFAFARQVQIACDTAKLAASRLSGKDAPVHADTETTLAELRARVASITTYLAGFTEADFAGAEARLITQPRWEGKTMTGANYLVEHALPNLYFHVAHAYAILRHAGVVVGKKDYLGALTMQAPGA